MKFSWGFGIFSVYLGFVLFMIALVVFSFSNDVNLVADNYYEKELGHQQEIDKAKRYAQLPGQIVFNQNAEYLSVKFPESFDKENISGKIFFFRDDNYKYDFSLPVFIDDSLIQQISLANVQKGFWRVSVDWKYNSTTYLTEKKIMVN